MNSKKILWQIIAIFTLFCLSKFDSIAGQSRDWSRGNKVRPSPGNSTRDPGALQNRCAADKFECSNGSCIDRKLVCNGFSDCPDGNDEGNDTCQNNKCSTEKFQCASGACIDKKYLCDGIKHCVFDANDEKRAACKNTACLATKYRCLTGSCLDRSLLCNGFADCIDSDDENTDTCENFECPKEKFRCSSGACIDKKFLCDGVRHCIFGTFDDESPELCKTKTEGLLDKYRCLNGASLDAQKLSNGFTDCVHADDENPSNYRNFKNQPQNNTSCLLPPESTHQTFTVHCLNTADCSNRAGEKVPIFTQIIVDCRAGYQFSDGNTSISSCFRGTWRPLIPKCYRICAPIRNPDLDLRCLQKMRGISIPCDDAMPEGAVVYPKCKEYYHQDREVDFSYIRCQSNGQWDRQLFKCIADCGRAQGNTQSLIVGGKPEQRGDSPWHVAIYDISNPNEPTLICGGTIITQQIIVSAAHCFYNNAGRHLYSSSLYEVVVAKYTLDYKVKDNSNTKVYKIRKIFTPEIITFTGESTNYVGDIALIWTSEKIAFSSGVLPACVEWTYTTRFIVPDGTEGKLVGWGLTENEKPSSVLLAALLPYVNYKNCREMVSEDFSIGADKFCAGTKKGAGARPGDSGGGLLFRKANTHGNLYYLRGIVSNKDGTIGEKRTSVAAFTDVAQFASWMYEKRIEIENEELQAETNVGLRT